MTRLGVSGIPTPVPIGSLLPSIYQQLDPNISRVTEGLDEVLATVWMTLDCFDSYVDPTLAPRDFVEMMAGWVGLTLDANWRDDQSRRLVAEAVELYRWRGTRRGLSELVEAYTGVEPSIDESGGVAWSAEPGGATPPGSPLPAVQVAVELPAGSTEDLARLTRLIAESVPAHVSLSVEIVRADAPPPPPPPPSNARRVAEPPVDEPEDQ